MKQYKYTTFSSLEIYDRQEVNEENYPRISLIEMDLIFPILLKSLVKENIIEKIPTEDDDIEDKEEIRYRWIENNISSSENRNGVNEGISALYIQVQEELKFYNNFDNIFLNNYNTSRFNNDNIELLKDFNEKIFDNKELSKKEIKDIQSLLYNSKREKRILLESYTNFVLSSTLKKFEFYEYPISQNGSLNMNPDIVYSSKSKDILVEVKAYDKPQLNNNVMNKIFLNLNRWEKLLKDNEDMKDFVAVLVIYDISTKNKNKEEDYSNLQNKWLNRFNSFFPEYKNKFFVILMPMISGPLLEKRILNIVEEKNFYY